MTEEQKERFLTLLERLVSEHIAKEGQKDDVEMQGLRSGI